MGREVLVSCRGRCLFFLFVCRILNDGKVYIYNWWFMENGFEGWRWYCLGYLKGIIEFKIVVFFLIYF